MSHAKAQPLTGLGFFFDMTETQFRRKFEALQKASTSHEDRPVTVHIERHPDGSFRAGEIQGYDCVLFRWPKRFRASIPRPGDDAKIPYSPRRAYIPWEGVEAGFVL